MALSAPRLVAGALVILAAVALARSDAEQQSPRRYNVADAMGSEDRTGSALAASWASSELWGAIAATAALLIVVVIGHSGGAGVCRRVLA
ncbi:unnamed protein product [Miscanthus lutarioriparius]|uniref:Uncharacterized protein n=1 Tax=Miscanthus lutarioriparius TaxID=422564 RepID=A0A811MYQ6_9POAL|nr:unnamed protein product [Miscanthus lutarioriparius]